jgi:hypothetical protein
MAIAEKRAVHVVNGEALISTRPASRRSQPAAAPPVGSPVEVIHGTSVSETAIQTSVDVGDSVPTFGGPDQELNDTATPAIVR